MTAAMQKQFPQHRAIPRTASTDDLLLQVRWRFDRVSRRTLSIGKVQRAIIELVTSSGATQ